MRDKKVKVSPMKCSYFFLDFDGVVCDSVPECFLSSHRAYHEFLRGDAVTSVSLREKELFYHFRPFIRAGEDYILLQDMIARGVDVTSQEVLDREIAAAGHDTMENYGRLFYRAREEVLREDRDFWLDLNPLFPGMPEILRRVSDNPRFYILSTKKPEFIREILSHHRISWDIERILFPGRRTKLQIIEGVLPRGEACEALFVDDQLDHLLTARKDPRIRPYLASWGYIKPEWLRQNEVPAVERKDLVKLTEGFTFLPGSRPL